jgi:hypothetical protein
MHYSVNKQKASWRIVDGEAVIVNTETTYYYGLNRTGTYVWNLLVDESLTCDEIGERLRLAFSGAGEEVTPDVKGLLENLVREQLLSVE